MHSTLCHAIRSGPKCMAPFCYAFWSRTKTHKRTETHITPAHFENGRFSKLNSNRHILETASCKHLKNDENRTVVDAF